MGKKGKIYIIIGVVTLALLMLFEFSKPKEINWFPSYVSHHKIPYGTLVVNELLEKVFPNKVEQLAVTPFEHLLVNDTVQGTYMFVNNEVSFDQTDLESLLNWVYEGNRVFIASENFSQKLLDTLKLETASLYSGMGGDNHYSFALTNPNLATKDSIFFTREYYQTFFQEVDTINAVALGWVFPKEIDSINAKKINIVQQPFGSGDFILSTFPEAFTNYFILKENNREYTGNLFSYLDHGQTLLIDNHYKTGKSFHTSPMYIFLNTKELKWAYYMALIGALVYVLFEGKRKQRAIPVKVPLKNQTLAFTRTIANMYFESGQTHTIAQHCIENFKDYIRTHHYVPTNHVDDAFFQAVALRTQHEKEEVESLFNYFDQLEKKPQLSNEQIKILNQKIEAFKKRAYGKSRT